VLRPALLTSLRARLIALAVVLAVLGGLAAVVLRSGDEGGGTGLTGACAEVHEGHDEMGWNPTQADEMIDSGCGWPYPPFEVSAEGGQADPALDAPFEPHPYAELWTAISDAGLGVCKVATLPEEPGDGFVFGFRYEAAEPGCPTATASVELIAREHVTRAHRDAAAHRLDEGTAFVLGRWSLQLVARDQTGGDRLAAQLEELGAEPVGAS
jgi:hypothetical protein